MKRSFGNYKRHYKTLYFLKGSLMRNRILGSLALMILTSALALGLAACATSSAPQLQSERGDARPVSVSVSVSAFNSGSPATQPADAGGYHISSATFTTLTTVQVESSGSATRTADMTAGNPANTNSPDVRPNIPINITPGSGTVLGR